MRRRRCNTFSGSVSPRGAVVTVEEPDAALVAGHPAIPPGFSLAGRPQLVARHIDERFIDVSIIFLIGVFRKGLDGQARDLGAALVPEDLLEARKR